MYQKHLRTGFDKKRDKGALFNLTKISRMGLKVGLLHIKLQQKLLHAIFKNILPIPF